MRSMTDGCPTRPLRGDSPLKGEGLRERWMVNETARHLRKVMTPQEVKLWVHLRALKKQHFYFRRQVPREGFIVDLLASNRGWSLRSTALSTASTIMCSGMLSVMRN